MGENTFSFGYVKVLILATFAQNLKVGYAFSIKLIRTIWQEGPF